MIEDRRAQLVQGRVEQVLLELGPRGAHHCVPFQRDLAERSWDDLAYLGWRDPDRAYLGLQRRSARRPGPDELLGPRPVST